MTSTPQRFNLLNHGYIEYKEHWGSDESIIESARMSTQKGFRSWLPYYECTTPGCNAWWPEYQSKPSGELGNRPCFHSSQPRYAKDGDNALLKYLWQNQHTTPFEMGGMVVELQAPIMVFREWHRHRTQSYNEASARYAPLPDINYVPTLERCMRNSTKNRQAGVVQGAAELTDVVAENWISKLQSYYDMGQELYQEGLDAGIPKELARLCLTVGRYSKMRASANLLNWLRFLKLRVPSNAQEEIRVYAHAMRVLLTDKFPRTMVLFTIE